jgi:hypothetical protein
MGTWMLHPSASFCIVSSSVTSLFLIHPPERDINANPMYSTPTHRRHRTKRRQRGVFLRNSQALEQGEMGCGVEGGDGEVELVEQAQSLLD